MLSQNQREAYWHKLCQTFRRVPEKLAFEEGATQGPEMKHDTSALSCLYSLDGERILVAGGGRLPGCDTSIRLFDRKSGKEVLVCRGHVCGIYQIAFDPHTGFLASASEDYSVILWNLEQEDAIFLVGGDPIVKGLLAFASEKRWLAIGEKEAYEDFVNSVFVIDLDSGSEVFRERVKNGKEVVGLAISADGTTLIASVAGRQHSSPYELIRWDISGTPWWRRTLFKQGRVVWKHSSRKMAIGNLRWLHGEEHLAAEIMDEEQDEGCSGVCLLDARSGKVLAKRLAAGIGSSVAVSPDGKRLAVAYGSYAEEGIELLEGRDLAPIKTLLKGDKQSPWNYCSLQFSPDGQTLLAGKGTGELQQLTLD